MAKAEITVHIDNLPIVQAKLAELDRIAAALRDEQPFPRTEVGDAIHNLRGRAEAAEHTLASERRERAAAAMGDIDLLPGGTAEQIRKALDGDATDGQR